MSFFDQLSDKLAAAGQGTMDKAKNFSETTKLNSRISDLEKQISMIYNNIGRAYYEAHKADEQSEFKEFLTQVNQLFNEIGRCKEQIRQIKGTVLCPNCGTELASNVAFCNVCGTKIPQQAPPTAEMQQQTPTTCPNCHSPINPDSAFCPSCGQALKS